MNLTENECYLIGKYLAGGCISDVEVSAKSSRKHVIYCIKKNKVAEFMRIASGYRVYHSEKDYSVTCTIVDQRLMELCVRP